MLNLRYTETRVIYTLQVIEIKSTESLDQAKIGISFQKERKTYTHGRNLEWEKKQTMLFFILKCLLYVLSTILEQLFYLILTVILPGIDNYSERFS